jgi:type IV pilus assembly protein PilE
MPKSTSKGKGFTLIELMIVVAVIAILASIAYPSYQNYVRQARRADAQEALMRIQLEQEKWRVNRTTYAVECTNCPPGENVLPNGIVMPTSDYYTFTIPTTSTGTTYTIRATAIANKGQDKDKRGGVVCSPLEITQNGKGPDACWRK